ncbi:hypothetical protein EMIHUDRAFT_454126 [Emiliania huxleyi CCMP1516]|uniref:Uncharacterized protein n=2 Tax=Emiliania huxleyi TaxID=2903 RepID=A0A0D3KYR5_EMIH1|nr:hypothetical protein EMIHUDRAFT_454126 [Emiliania huxleyi CCMP1516]EOD40900.1 hypothetical protein EMIHUDRAFT_454126 [Emiliania huxleyi CCMP1516]|eukprot:XP_005793329.1 hypothetical protein EMIHUDRAFT_454126 [Emiliania huxleyi CCMP1516]
MPKASPSKAPLPKKPREPKKVKDVALNTMRVANYKAKMAVYEEEMAAYKVGQRRREADKVAVKRRLSASDADPAAPAAKRPTPAPTRGTCDVCFGRLAAGDDIDVCFRCEPETGSAAGGRWRCRDCRAAAAALAASVAGELPTASASKRQRALAASEAREAEEAAMSRVRDERFSRLPQDGVVLLDERFTEAGLPLGGYGGVKQRLFGGPHAEVEYFLAVVLATRAAEYRSELGGRSIRIGTITNSRWCSITGTRLDGSPGRAPRAAIKVSYPNSWFLARESDDEMVARDPCWRRNNYGYSDPRCEYALAVVEALREVDWREEQPLLRDFRHLEDYESAYRAAYRSQRAAAEEREAQARYKVLRLPWEVKKPLLVALEAAQAEAAPELREESRVLRARRPTRRQLAAAVAGGWSKYKDSLPFWSPNPTRRAQQEAWFEEVAMLAEQAGVDGMLYPWLGEWCDDDASDYDEEYLPCHREDVLFDLDSNGRRPTAAELAPLAWPHSCWWHDRDRIVLLYMHMLDNPPDGSFLWEARVCEQVHALWAEAEAMREEGMRMAFVDGALPGGEDIPGAAFVVGRAVTAPRRLMTHQCFEDEAAPGWRMLSSLPSCPNPHMRFPIESGSEEARRMTRMIRIRIAKNVEKRSQ